MSESKLPVIRLEADLVIRIPIVMEETSQTIEGARQLFQDDLEEALGDMTGKRAAAVFKAFGDTPVADARLERVRMTAGGVIVDPPQARRATDGELLVSLMTEANSGGEAEK
jgi:hypothetical protein